MTGIKALDNGKYSITNGEVTMVVDAAHGAKILSFKLGNDEVLNQGTIENSFGSTFWTSPQKEWEWPPVPEYDSKPFKAEIAGDKLVATGEKSSFGYSIRKQFTAGDKPNTISITYTIVNESGEVRKVAPWEISRVPNDDGIVFFEGSAVEPGNGMGLLPFTFQFGGAWFVMDEHNDHRKINADGRGWLACSSRGLLFVKKFQDLTPEQPAPGEAEIQAYANIGKTFVEIEEQGEYTTLQPGASLDYNVRWSVAHTSLKPVPSAELFEQAKKLTE